MAAPKFEIPELKPIVTANFEEQRECRMTPFAVTDASREKVRMRFKLGSLAKHISVTPQGIIIGDAYPDDVYATFRNLEYSTSRDVATVNDHAAAKCALRGDMLNEIVVLSDIAAQVSTNNFDNNNEGRHTNGTLDEQLEALYQMHERIGRHLREFGAHLKEYVAAKAAAKKAAAGN